jgi:hypothetical protein
MGEALRRINSSLLPGAARGAVYGARVSLDTSLVRVRVAPGPLSGVTTASRALVLALSVEYGTALTATIWRKIFSAGRCQ